ncbi:MAG: response regulator transcription factor [Acidimicrobiales bacterium]
MTALARRPILVVEDDADVRDLLSRRLTHLGHVVLAAATGEEALELADESPPALVVLDIRLPGIDGWEVLRRLRARPATSGAGVLVVSVLDPTDNHPEVDGYLVKPFRITSIDRLVAGILSGVGPRNHDDPRRPHPAHDGDNGVTPR